MKHEINNENDVRFDFESKYLLFQSTNPLKYNCNAIIDKLMLHHMDTYQGILVVCE